MGLVLSWVLAFYLSLPIIFFINSLISAFLKIQIVQHFYLNTLDKLFTYAASAIAHEKGSTLEGNRNESIENFEKYDEDLIERDIQLTEKGVQFDPKLALGDSKGFKLHHPIYLVKCGIEAIIEDSVTKRFTAAELRVWNFLSRNQSYVYVNKDHQKTLTTLWLLGFCIRYFIFLPCRFFNFAVSFLIVWMMGLIGGKMRPGRLRQWLLGDGLQAAVRLNLCSFSAVIRFHNRQNRPKRNTICVANHTTPVDWCVLASDVTYAVVGQKQSGFFGLVETLISSAVPTVWFDREEILDRNATALRLRQHVNTPDAEALLIFPEGTCINNTSVMKFKKGCFEVGASIHPVAIKYNPLFADCFWNSSRDSLFRYVMKMMTSWAMVVDVWYLPPTMKSPDEDGIAFAGRVQKSIAQCGGLINMDWDGDLKRRMVKDVLKVAQQKHISEFIIGGDTK